MKPLNYIISNYGLGIAIGITGNKQLAEQDAILAENIYGSNHSDDLFTSLIYMASVRQFQKFLTLKEYFLIWDEHWGKNKIAGRRDPALILQFTRRAIKRARLVMESNVRFENFMQGISARNNTYEIGGYQDEAAEA
jgi:hypothetical protein